MKQINNHFIVLITYKTDQNKHLKRGLPNQKHSKTINSLWLSQLSWLSDYTEKTSTCSSEYSLQYQWMKTMKRSERTSWPLPYTYLVTFPPQGWIHHSSNVNVTNSSGTDARSCTANCISAISPPRHCHLSERGHLQLPRTFAITVPCRTNIVALSCRGLEHWAEGERRNNSLK